MKIKYEIDNKRKSNVVIIGVHGLGMDASMFKKFVKKSDYRVIAPTLAGSSIKDNCVEKIGIMDHVSMVKVYIKEKLPKITMGSTLEHKRLVLVGFSMGADIIREIARDKKFNSEISGIEYVLLDPNVGLKTCFLSSKMAQFSVDSFEHEIIGLLRRAEGDKETFKVLLDYLNQIVKKFGQRPEYIAHLAKTMTDLYKLNSGKNTYVNDLMSALEDSVDRNLISMNIYFSKDEETAIWENKYKKSGGLVFVNKIEGGHFDLAKTDFLLKITK